MNDIILHLHSIIYIYIPWYSIQISIHIFISPLYIIIASFYIILKLLMLSHSYPPLWHHWRNVATWSSRSVFQAAVREERRQRVQSGPRNPRSPRRPRRPRSPSGNGSGSTGMVKKGEAWWHMTYDIWFIWYDVWMTYEWYMNDIWNGVQYIYSNLALSWYTLMI